MSVALVTMPYVALEHPSIGLSILASGLQALDITCRVHYANLAFADLVGLDTYELVTHTPAHLLLGEWTFAEAASADHASADHPSVDHPSAPTEAYLQRALQGLPETLIPALHAAREAAAHFCATLAEQLLEQGARIVGCSSTFQQNCPSLALLKKLKQLDPTVVTVMGGANCEGRMGAQLLKSFPWLDLVLSGEAELVFPPLCQAILDDNRLPDKLPLTALTRDALPPDPPRATLSDLDRSPIPDYSDYFAALKRSRHRRYITPGLLMETSRGCWWGQKHHCTFCGLNGEGMGYRSKSPTRVIAEFKHLSETYQVKQFEVVDNILDMKHIKTVLPVIKNEGYQIFYETKANLTEPQVDVLADAGVVSIQPGLESMHDNVLDLMDKGNTAAMNVQLLKWCKERGIRVAWSILYAFPGEQDEDYREMASWLDLVAHLEPPIGLYRIRYDRFSPYHTEPEKYKVRLTPYWSYRHIYPLTTDELRELAYFFEDEPPLPPGRVPEEEEPEKRPGLILLKAAVERWQACVGATLTARDRGDRLEIYDTRPCATAKYHELEGPERDLLLACNRASRLEADPAVVASLKAKKLLLEVSGRYLALPTGDQLRPYCPHFPGGTVRLRDYLQKKSRPGRRSSITR